MMKIDELVVGQEVTVNYRSRGVIFTIARYARVVPLVGDGLVLNSSSVVEVIASIAGFVEAVNQSFVILRVAATGKLVAIVRGSILSVRPSVA
jgi:hypothetical protein